MATTPECSMLFPAVPIAREILCSRKSAFKTSCPSGISDLQADHVLSHIGKAQGIINVLRSVPYVPRSSPLPVNILASHKVTYPE